MIPWWHIEVSEPEIDGIAAAIRRHCVSQGAVTEQFEEELAAVLGAGSGHVVCTTSGTMALLLAFLGLGVKPGDEVVMPDRTFVATAHAAMLLGARIRMVDVEADVPAMDVDQLERAISPRTKVIVPVHLNGHAPDMERVMAIARRHNIDIIEDAAQAVMSTHHGKYLGTMGRFGCFSLGMAKMITTGQGGFVVCRDKRDADLLRRLRNQGVNNVREDMIYNTLAGNFKFTDVQAAMGLAQIKRIPGRIERQKKIFTMYEDGLRGVPQFKVPKVFIDRGEVPLRVELLCVDRYQFIKLMHAKGVQVVPQIPSLHESPHLEAMGTFPRSQFFSKHSVMVPCGPDQALDNVRKAIDAARECASQMRSWNE